MPSNLSARSILDDVMKRIVGTHSDETPFKDDIIMCINNAFGNLTDLGVGPALGFSIEDEEATWGDFLSDMDPRLERVKNYVCQKVKLEFDPPSSGTHMEALKESIKELEWRLNSVVDYEDDPENRYGMKISTKEDSHGGVIVSIIGKIAK